MVEEYKLVRTTTKKIFENIKGEKVVIPVGTEAHVVDKFDNGWCIIEFVDHDAGYPIVADYLEDELEMVEED